MNARNNPNPLHRERLLNLASTRERASSDEIDASPAPPDMLVETDGLSPAAAEPGKE